VAARRIDDFTFELAIVDRSQSTYHIQEMLINTFKLMNALVILAGFVFSIAAFSNAVLAAELVMFERQGCEWCEAWDEEIAPIYPKTVEAKIAPLRRVDMDDPVPASFQDLKAVIYSPTFVLMNQGREIGRIVGYAGPDFFWAQLEELLKKHGYATDKKDQDRALTN